MTDDEKTKLQLLKEVDDELSLVPFDYAMDLLRQAQRLYGAGKHDQAMDLMFQSLLAAMNEATEITDALRDRIDELESELASIEH